MSEKVIIHINRFFGEIILNIQKYVFHFSLITSNERKQSMHKQPKER